MQNVVEAVKSYIEHPHRTSKLECGAIFLKNIPRKVNTWSITICKETFLKACDSLKSGAALILSIKKFNVFKNFLVWF